VAAKKETSGDAKRQATREARRRLSAEQRLVKALAHPLRVEILGLLNLGEWSPRTLSDHLDEGLSQVSYHVEVLDDYELIELTRTKQVRGATQHFYRAIRLAWVPAGMARNIPKSAQSIIGSAYLEKIDKDVATSLESGRFYDRDDWHTSWTPLNFDGQAREDAEKDIDEFLEKMLTREAESANRRANGEGEGGHIWTSVAILLFGSDVAQQDQKPVRKSGRKKKRG
jgi:DNA-binding transcriptional ArsR family regulator